MTLQKTLEKQISSTNYPIIYSGSIELLIVKLKLICWESKPKTISKKIKDYLS
jgi:hypothetical protein